MRKLLLSLACFAVAIYASAQAVEAQAQLDKSLTLHESYTKAGPLVSTSSAATTTKKKAAADGVYFQTQGTGWVWSERPLYSYNRPYQIVPALTEIVYKNMSFNKRGDWFVLNEGTGSEIDQSQNVDKNGDLHMTYKGGESGYYAPSYRVGDVTYIPTKGTSTYRNEVSDLSLLLMFSGNLDGAKYYGGGIFDNGNLYGAGTYQGLTSMGVYMRLPKPAGPLYVENLSVWGCLGKNISIEEGANPLGGQTLVAAIYNVEDEEAEPVYLTCTPEECIWDRGTYYILHFTQKVLDEASGEMVETPFVIDYEAEVDLLGFNQEGVVVGIMGPEVPAEFVSTFVDSEGKDQLYYQGNMLFTDGEKQYSMAYNGCTSVAVSFNAVFDKIDVWEDDKTEEGEAIKINGIRVSDDGANSTNNYYGLNKGAFVATALNWFATDADGNLTGEEKYWSDDMYDYEWIRNLTSTWNDDLEYYEISATCDPLPKGVEKRYAKIHIVGKGCESTPIYVLQGNITLEEAIATEEDYKLYASNIKTRAGKQVELSLNLSNTNPITLWQADLVLPKGFSVATDLNGNPKVSLSGNRTNTSNHSVAGSLLENGTVRLLCYSATNKTFTGTDGEVAKIVLDIDKNVVGGDYSVFLKNIKLVEPTEKAHYKSSVSSTITIKNYTLGDVNDDGTIDGVDLVGIINVILGINSGNVIFDAADVNGDGEITIVDAVGVVNIILYGSATPPMKSKAYIANTHETPIITCKNLAIAPGETKPLQIRLSNAQCYAGMQFDIDLPEGINIVGDNKSDIKHFVATAPQSNGSERVVCYSISSDAFTDNNVVTLFVKADETMAEGKYTGTVLDAKLATPKATSDKAKNSCFNITVAGTTDINVLANSNKVCNVYDLNGRMISNGRLSEIIVRLNTGVYIIDGKKYVK